MQNVLHNDETQQITKPPKRPKSINKFANKGTKINTEKGKDHEEIHNEIFKQFDVYFLYLPPNEFTENSGIQQTTRPCIIISNNMFNEHAPVVNVLPITTKAKTSPVHIPVYIEATQKLSYILCEQCMTVTKHQLINCIGHLEDEYASMILERLKFQFSVHQNTSEVEGYFNNKVIPKVI
jgi:mRNA-degrading endonuclease toxin of MazEF toxin-antitoxin module